MAFGSIKQDIEAAVTCMRAGGVILYPTDTVWGLGCDATREDAVARLFEIKRRAESKAMISLVSDLAMLERYTDEVPEVALELMELSVRPTTVVLDSPRGLAPSLRASDGSAAFRMTSEVYSRGLCRGLRRPVVSTSANVSGEPTPALFGEIAAEIVSAVDYVAQYRRDDTEPARSSSVIKIGNDCTVRVIRK